MLGEDDQLAPVAGRVEHLGVVWSSAGKLRPTCVSVAGAADLAASSSRPARVAISARSSAMVCAAVAWSTSSSSSSSSSSSGGPRSRRGRRVDSSRRRVQRRLQPRPRAARAAPRRAGLEALAAAPERLVDRLGRGGQPALEDGEREADALPRRPSPSLQPLGAVHLLADVVGDLVVEDGLGVGERVRDACRRAARGTAACRRT